MLVFGGRFELAARWPLYLVMLGGAAVGLACGNLLNRIWKVGLA